MTAVLLVIHVLIALALIAVVLLQRSEGGALGIGGGGGGAGGFMTGRGAANLLTRSTAILGVAFFATSIVLTLLARNASNPASVIDNAAQRPGQVDKSKTPPSPILPKLPPRPQGPQVPTSR